MDNDTDNDTEAPAAGPAHRPGDVRRYPVEQADGSVRHQLILVTGADDDGAVRGVPLGYEHQAARFAAGDLDG